ncbi:MAG: class I SAM-dependent RNA methyltransferase, partial [Pikeienuella sp.]
MERITIERLAAEGDGEGAGVFVPFALPGEIAQGEVADGRMAAPEIISPSRFRRAASCSHFGLCGGCNLQHAGDGFLSDWKRDRIAAALAARGVAGAEIREPLTSPPHSRRRAGFAARRTKRTVIAGFHRRAGDDLIAIEACDVVAPALLGALEAVRAAAALGASRKGAIRAMATLSEGGVDLAVEEAKPLERAALVEAAALATTHDLARLSWNGDVVATRRPPAQRFGAALVVPPPGAFLQATA